MAINTEYYGTSDTWADMSSSLSHVTVKVPTANPYDAAGTNMGAFCILWGREWAETGDYQVELDRSFAYIGMDADAPQLRQEWTSRLVHSGDLADRYAYIRMQPSEITPVGWMMGNLGGGTGVDYPNPQFDASPHSAQYSTAPFDYDPTWLPTSWSPPHGTSTYYGGTVDYLVYYGSHCAPVLSWDFYRRCKLVPLITCCSLTGGHTAADLAACTDISQADAMLGSFATYDLDAYIRQGAYLTMPVVVQVGCAAVRIDFAATPGNPNTYYFFDGASSLGTMQGVWTPAYLSQEKYPFTSHWLVGEDTEIADSSTYMCLIPTGLSYGTQVMCADGYSRSTGYSGHWILLGTGRISGAKYFYTPSNKINIWPECVDRESWNLLEFASGYAVNTLAYKYIDESTKDDFVEYVRKAVAYYGMFFSDGVVNAVPETADMNTAGLHLGIVDASGVTHGEYTTGTYNVLAPNYMWTKPVEETPYDPVPTPPSPDQELPSDGLMLNTSATTGFGVACRYYALRRSDIDDIYSWIYWYMDYDHAVDAATQAGDPYETIFQQRYPTPADWYAYVCTQAGYGQYPTDDIISLMAFPFDVSGSDAGYQLGSWDTSLYHNYFQLVTGTPLLTGKIISGSGVQQISLCGDTAVTGLYGDYRDYQPYCRMELQVPYHGTVDIDPGDWIGHTLSVTALVDLMTGSSLAVILRDGAPVITMPGQMGISVPISKDAVSQTAVGFTAMSTAYQASAISFTGGLMQSALRFVGGAAQAVIGAATLDIKDVLKGSSDAGSAGYGAVTDTLVRQQAKRQAQYEMDHIIQGRMVTGGGSSVTLAAYETQCRLVRHYPRLLAGAAGYSDISGHACSDTGTVGADSQLQPRTGWTQFGGVDLSGISATDAEKTEILGLLQSGVYL